MQMHVFSLQGGASRCDLEYVRCAMNNGDARNISMRLLPTSHVYDSYVYRPLVKDPYRMCIACSYAYASVSSVAPCLSFVGRSYLTCGATWLKSLVYASNSFVGCSASVSSVAVPQFRRLQCLSFVGGRVVSLTRPTSALARWQWRVWTAARQRPAPPHPPRSRCRAV